jgi:hypothetical protein
MRTISLYISAGRLLIQGSIFLPVVKHIEPWRILAILIRPVNLPSPKYFDYLWFPTCLLWAYQTMVIRETRACVLNYIRYLRCIYSVMQNKDKIILCNNIITDHFLLGVFKRIHWLIELIPYSSDNDLCFHSLFQMEFSLFLIWETHVCRLISLKYYYILICFCLLF